MKKLITYFSVLILVSLLSCDGRKSNSSRRGTQKTYNTSHESIASYGVPTWYSEGKLGIFMHLSAFSVIPYGNEWYASSMYFADDNPTIKGKEHRKKARVYHEENYGSLKEFGYKDFIPLLKMEKFDADYYADLVKRSGATYFAAPAVHHDGFAMWDSKVIDWNSVKMGPKRDVVGELTAAMRSKGIKTGVSTHYGRHWKYYTFRPEFDTWDRAYEGLYGKRRGDLDPPRPEDALKWESVMNELIDNYQPDYIFVDGGICDAHSEYQKEYFRDALYRTLARYYNKSIDWDKEVVLSWKRDAMLKGEAVYDTEKNLEEGIPTRPWQAHFTANGRWAYSGETAAYPINAVLRCFIDLVSRNGNMLLNIAPRPDGTLDKAQENLLLELGQWMEVNAEGIKGSTPWEIYGAGELNSLRGGSKINEYDSNAIRYTQKDGILYAWFVSWPESGKIILPQASKFNPIEIKALGGVDSLKFVHEGSDIIVELPAQQFGQHVWGLKLCKT
ncbi:MULTISPECIES: alpha-L-fucosidase [unclassified Carboxylicivirga]|uniref:alpha-L-fucosidase n=1 Tax=Carboxylicivirga TaxID=1628153 RepID=UPI003D34A2C4